MSLLTTPSQTVGPYLKIGFLLLLIDASRRPECPENVTVRGRMSDGMKADQRRRPKSGRMRKYAHPKPARKPLQRTLSGVPHHGQGAHFTTVKPGPVAVRRGAKRLASGRDVWRAAVKQTSHT
jgi:hypothetical protein